MNKILKPEDVIKSLDPSLSESTIKEILAKFDSFHNQNQELVA